MLETLLDLELAGELPVTTLIGLCADPNTTWVDLRAGELKTLAALAAGDTHEILDGCAWIAQLGELPDKRARIYRCIENIVHIREMAESEDTAAFEENLTLLYGTETSQQAHKLLNCEE